ncbi:MAG: hypothetical protein RIQ76_910 [Pseudomonadota bacterium]|jgi:hypothetical protein
MAERVSRERELLKKVISGDNKGDFFISYDLYKEIYEFLVHPEQTEQGQDKELIAKYREGYKKGFLDGAEPEQTEQEPVAWMYERVNEIGETVKRVVCNFYEDVNLIPLYTAPQKREPLSDEAVSELLMGGFSTHLMDLVRMVEKAHGIGGGG